MTNRKNSTTRFTVDFLNKKIIGTKASFDKAAKGVSPVYEELAEKVRNHPDFALEVKEQKKKSNKPKRTYEGLNSKFMEDYIDIQTDKARLMAEYQSVQRFAKASGMSVFPFTKKWFLKKFGKENEGFNMEAAKQEISDARMAEAVQAAPAIVNDAA